MIASKLDNRNPSDFQLKGFHVAALMIAFFGVIIAVNLFMATLAARSWTGLVVKNSYVASQAFNDELQEARAQREAGWSTAIEFDNGELAVFFEDREGKRLLPTDVVLQVGRPAFEQKDRSLELRPGGSGSFEVALPLEQGDWSLRVLAYIDGKPYRRDARIFVKTDGTGVVE